MASAGKAPAPAVQHHVAAAAALLAELNPMENIWDYLRGNKLSRLVWNSYDAIVAACKEAWLFLIADPDRINSIANRSWASVNP
jgi:hypothetical protein